MNELISVIVPAYNVDKYISECLESILTQTYKNLEIIVVDDGSTDNTHEILQSYEIKDYRIRVFSQANAGVVCARAKGISEAKGYYLGFVDGDDWIDPDMFEKMANGIGDSDLVSCSILRQWTPGRKEVVKNCFYKDNYSGSEYESFIRSMMFDFNDNKQQRLTPWMCNKLFRSDIAREINILELKGIRNYEDMIFVYLYMLKAKSVCFIQDASYHYRYRPDSAIHAENKEHLIDVGRLYSILKTRFEKSKYRDYLIPQLQKLTQILVFNGFERNMKFDSDFSPIQFTMDFGELKGKKIILYGAGRCGKDFHKQLMAYGYEVCLWCDADTSIGNVGEYEISPPDAITDYIRYDSCLIVLIAVNNEERADDIKNILLQKGLLEDMIFWRKPFRVY